MKKSEWNYPHKFFQAMLTCMNVFLRTCFYIFLQTNSQNLNIFSFMTIEKQYIWCALSPTMLSREIFLEVLDIRLLVNFTTSLRSLWLLPSIALTPFCNPSFPQSETPGWQYEFLRFWQHLSVALKKTKLLFLNREVISSPWPLC